MRERFHKIAICAILFLLFAGAIATAASNNKKQETDTVQVKEFQPLTDIKEGRPDIYVIVKSMTSSYWKVLLKGAKQAGIDEDCNIYATGSTLETEWKVQQEEIELALEQGADAIILGPDSSVKLSSEVEKVHNKGIPIIIVDTIVNTDKYDVCYMTDNLLAGENAAKEMLRMLKEKGRLENEDVKVAVQLGARESQTINERLAGFCQYWTKFAPKNWKIIDEILCNDGDEELAVEMSDDFFKRYPDIDGVFGTDNASSMGFSSAIMKIDNKDVVMVGFDYSPEVAQIVENGEYNVSIMLQKQYDMGYNSVDSAVSILNDQHIELMFVDTGVAVLNKDTFESDEIQQIIKRNRGK